MSACYSMNVCTCIIKLYIFTKDEYTEKLSLTFRGFSSALSGCLGSLIQTPMEVPFTVRSLAFVPLIPPLLKGFSSPKINSFWPMYRKHMWQSHVEIEVYSIAYFNRFAALEVPYHWTFIKGGADMRFTDSLGIHASTKHVWAPPSMGNQWYGASNTVMQSKNLQFLHGTATYTWLVLNVGHAHIQIVLKMY